MNSRNGSSSGTKRVGSGGGSLLRVLRVFAALVVCLSVGVFSGQAQTPEAAQPAVIRDGTQTLSINVGRATALHTPWVVNQVAVADPEVADLQVVEPQQIMVIGKAPGSTDLIVWGEGGNVWQTRVNVSIDLNELNRSLEALFPGAAVRMSTSQDVYCLTGMLRDADQAKQLHAFMDALQFKYVDMTQLAGLQQVQLRVRVAEANRVAIRKLGVNALRTGDKFFGAITIGPDQGGTLNSIPIGPPGGTPVGHDIPFVIGDVGISPLTTLIAGFPPSDLEFFIQALVENQYLRVLAEPTLVALSGEDASFLAGGEFPIPIVQSAGGAGGTSVTVEWKEFGVRLKFRPSVLGDGTIRLYVAPEVSDLTDIGAVEIQGFRIPSLLTRRSETTLEMQAGQTFAMAGLFNESTTARNSRVPLMGDLPVIGSLFRSISYKKGESELLILVTAELVEPLSITERPSLPGDSHVEPSTWELFMLGRLEGKRKPAQNPEAECEAAEMSSLKGPEPWASVRPAEAKQD